MVSQWLTFLGLMLVIGLWLAALRGRDRALLAARELCRTREVQLLDETVGLSALRPCRLDGHLHLRLRYDFEISMNGMDRHSAHLWMVQGHVVGLRMDLPPGHAESATHPSNVTSLLERMRRNGST